MNIIERISRSGGVANFQTAPDELKLKIYKLTLQEIFTVLGQDLEMFSENYLEDIKVSLREIINGFYSLRTQPKDINIDFMQILPRLLEANANLLSATTHFEGGKDKNVKFYLALQICREKIFETLEYLE